MFSGAVSAFIQALPEMVFGYIADIGRRGGWGAQRQDVTPQREHGPDATFAASIHILP